MSSVRFDGIGSSLGKVYAAIGICVLTIAAFKITAFMKKHFSTKIGQPVVNRKINAVLERKRVVSRDKSSQEELSLYYIRDEGGLHFERFLSLHKRFWCGSQTYRQCVAAIQERKEQPFTILDREQAIKLYAKRKISTPRLILVSSCKSS